MPEDEQHKSERPQASDIGGERKEILPATNEQLHKINEAAGEVANQGEKEEIHRADFSREIGVWAQTIKRSGEIEGQEELPRELDNGIAYLSGEGINWVRFEGGQLVLVAEKAVEPGEEGDEIAVMGATEKTLLSKVQAETILDVLELLRKGELNDALTELEDVVWGNGSDVEVADEELTQEVKSSLVDLCDSGQKTVTKRNRVFTEGSTEDDSFSYVDVEITDLEPAEAPYEKLSIKHIHADKETSQQSETTFSQNSDDTITFREEMMVFGIGDTDEEREQNFLDQINVGRRRANREMEDQLGLTQMTYEQASKILYILEEAKA
jgi:hypothetical protein